MSELFGTDYYVPNEETVKAIENVSKGIGLSRGFDSVYELMRDLESDD
ncbi:MAG: hypothetical protein LUD77_07260 [Clostridiales bacterium]|nr:hypothetical protein [Clostridiales bacterium]